MAAIGLMRILLMSAMLLTVAQAQQHVWNVWSVSGAESGEGVRTLLERNATQLWSGEESVTLFHLPELQRFYAARGYQPAWESESDVEALLRAIDLSADDGLDPSNAAYHRALLERLSALRTAGYRGVRELLLSDAFMGLGYHLFRGVLYGMDVDVIHHAAEQRPLDMPALLEAALKKGRVAEALAALAPTHARYRNLKKALARYEGLAYAGGWDEDPEAYRDIEKIKQRLAVTGEYDDAPEESAEHMASDEASDDLNRTGEAVMGEAEREALDAAIKAFQRRHNIAADGIVGPMTRSRLAEGVQAKLGRIRLNLERWRWFSTLPCEAYLLVNIPDFSLQFVTAEKQLSMKVVVGREGRKTPMMEAVMRYLVFNPYWRIPETILGEDILPKLRRDSGYLRAHEIALFSASDGAERHPLNPASIDWRQVSKAGMRRYIFRQAAGPKNPLGVVKFIFPNRYDVYIHDTPSRHHFENNTLLASSGCIRAEKPIELAYDILVREQPEMTYKTLFDLLRTGERRVIRLEEGVPVYVTYQTAWADEDGTLFVRDDAYGYDAELAALLKQGVD